MRFSILFIAGLVLYAPMLIGQDRPDTELRAEQTLSITDDTWLSPEITDDMTKDPEQNRLWRLGQSKYSSRPKDLWEVGVHAGHYFIDGDVDVKLPGWGVGGHLRKSFNYITSIRFEAFYGKATGLESQPWRNRSVGGGLVEGNEQFNGWDAYDPTTGGADSWFPSYETTYIYASTQLVFNVGNILFHQERNKWNTYVAVGVGLDHNRTYLDLEDANGAAYEDLRNRVGFNTTNDFNTLDGRNAIKDALDEIYDGTFETEAFQQEGIFRFGDDINVHVVFNAAVGVSRKITKRINIGLEHQLLLTDNDYLDGIKFRTALDQTNNVDIGHYTNFRLGFNIGNFGKRTEPLYWLNPMSTIFNEIADLKARPQLDLDDDDNDGVLNILDLEPDTPDGCLVDTKGVTLDSDGDGLPDCLDKEPFSPPGYPIDELGVAQVDEPVILTEEDVITIIENNCDACANTGYGQVINGSGQVGSYSGTNPQGGTISGGTGTTGTVSGGTSSGGTVSGGTTTGGQSGAGTGTVSGGQVGGVNGSGNPNPTFNQNTYGTIVNNSCGNWFLPMLHFDLDKYAIRPESYPKLHQIASVMKSCPSMCVTAHGHTDVRNSNRYNQVLSYNRAKEAIEHLVTHYGIDRSRFNLMFGGEDSPLIPHLQDNHFTDEEEELMQFINRRVEFRVCDGEDINMGRPEGPEAGTNSLGSSRPGSKYKSYKNSGY